MQNEHIRFKTNVCLSFVVSVKNIIKLIHHYSATLHIQLFIYKNAILND